MPCYGHRRELIEEVRDGGCVVRAAGGGLLRGDAELCHWLRAADGREPVNVEYVLSGLIVVVILVYLLVALLRPERF